MVRPLSRYNFYSSTERSDMIISGFVITVVCDSGEYHEYSYGTATYTGKTMTEAVAVARREGWIVDQKNDRCLCPVHVKLNDARYDD